MIYEIVMCTNLGAQRCASHDKAQNRKNLVDRELSSFIGLNIVA